MRFKLSKNLAVNCVLCAGIVFSLFLLGFSIKALLNVRPIIPQVLMIHLGLPLLLLGAFCAAFKMAIDDKIQLLSLIFSTIICLYVVETFLFLKDFNVNYQANMLAAQKAGKPFDTRSLSKVILDMRSQGINAFPSFMPRQFVTFADQYPQLLGGIGLQPGKIIPLGGVSRSTIVCCNEGGSWVTYLSDEYGFNNPAGLYQPGLDFVALGDSYVEGHCVGPEQNSVADLRKTGKRALALGKAGNGPLAMLATLREFGEALKPKVVLWYFYEEDELAFLGKERDTVLTQYLDWGYSQHLMPLQPEIDQRLTAFTKEELMKESSKGNFETRSLGSYLSIFYKNILFLKDVLAMVEPQNDPVAAHLPLFKDILKQAKERVEGWGGRLYVIYLPSSLRFEKDMDQEQQGDLFGRKKILDEIKALGVPVVDIVPVFKQNPDPLNYFIFRRHNHYTPEGYAAIAQAILKGTGG